MWKKLIAGAVIVVALIVLVAVSYVRAVIGSYQIELVSQGKVVGSGEFTITLESFDPSWSLDYQGEYYAQGKLDISEPIKEFVRAKSERQAIAGKQIAISEFHIKTSGSAWIKLANSGPDSYFMIDIEDIRGRVSQGKFGYVDFGGGLDEFCQCTVTRK